MTRDRPTANLLRPRGSDRRQTYSGAHPTQTPSRRREAYRTIPMSRQTTVEIPPNQRRVLRRPGPRINPNAEVSESSSI
jgi:hypothetical protein